MAGSELEAKRLSHFMAVYEHGGFSGAAAALFISQPALSNSVRKLEARLGVALFERNSRGVSPTVFGDALYRRSKLIRAEQARAIEDIAALRGGTAGRLNVGVGPSVIDQIAQVVSTLIAHRPELVLSFVEGPEELLHQGLLSGDIDFAISTMSRGGPRDNELHYEALFSNPTIPIVRSEHPLARRRAIRWTALAQYPWIIGDSRMEPLDQQLLDAVATWDPPSVVSCNSAALMRSVAASSDFVTFMPATLAYRTGGAARLVALGSANGLFSADIGLTYRSSAVLPPTADLFIAEFRKSCAKLKLRRAKEPVELL